MAGEPGVSAWTAVWPGATTASGWSSGSADETTPEHIGLVSFASIRLSAPLEETLPPLTPIPWQSAGPALLAMIVRKTALVTATPSSARAWYAAPWAAVLLAIVLARTVVDPL